MKHMLGTGVVIGHSHDTSDLAAAFFKTCQTERM